MFLSQLFLSLTQVLKWHGKYVLNFVTLDPMYEFAIYSIYKLIFDDGYDH